MAVIEVEAKRNIEGSLLQTDDLNAKATEVSENPNIGALGTAAYQEDSRRVKGFCGEVVDDASIYMRYLEDKVYPVISESTTNERVATSTDATRIIDRAIVRHGLVLPVESLTIPLQIEAIVPLGGEWEGYDWVMVGTNLPGRQLSPETQDALVDLAQEAAELNYEAPQPLPNGYAREQVGPDLSEFDLQTLADIFKASFTDYISPLTTPEDVKAWLSSDTVFPVVVRNDQGQIVAVASGDKGEFALSGRPFKFMEIGDSAANPEYRGLGLNRNIKHFIISQAAKMGFNSVHTETRAAWGAPNFGNAKNGMSYSGTLFMNCKISGIEDVPETKDPALSEDSRHMGSLNVWAITEQSPLWQQYLEQT